MYGLRQTGKTPVGQLATSEATGVFYFEVISMRTYDKLIETIQQRRKLAALGLAFGQRQHDTRSLT